MKIMQIKQLIKIILKTFLYTNCIQWGIYFTVYFCVVFAQWDFYNPFWWLMELPDQTIEFRSNMLGIIAMIYSVKIPVAFFIHEQLKDDLNESDKRNSQ